MSRLLRSITPKQITAAKAGDSWTLPTSLEWMPAGSHEINALLDGWPSRMLVTASEQDVPHLDAQLQSRLKLASAGQASRPFIDFDHEGRRAAGLPTRFYWDSGIRLEIQWTAAGKAALEGSDYSYFSPEFYLDDNTGHPIGIADAGPIGALVNTPAFQTIQKLAASQADVKTKEKSMKKLLDALVGAKLIPSATLDEDTATAMFAERWKAQADQVAAQLTERDNTIAAQKTRIGELEGSVAAQQKAAADTAISAAVKSGKIKDDEAVKARWTKAYLAAPGETQAMLDDLPEAKRVTAGVPPLPAAKGSDGEPTNYTDRCLAANGGN